MATSWELHMLLGTYLRSADKKCMACVILSSDITLGCVRYSCKYSAMSIISIDIVSDHLLYAPVVVDCRSYTKSFASSLIPGFAIV